MSVVIIPAYEPDETFVRIVDELWTYGCQIVAVDDGSGEGYQQIFDRVGDICIVLRHGENRGKGAAIKTALSYIERELWDDGPIGIMDCDGQHLPEDMMRLFRTAGTRSNTLVLGVRAVGKEMPLRSRLGNQITRAVYRIVSGVNVSDTQTGLRAFGPDLIDRSLSVKGDRYEYEMNMLMACAREKISIEEVPIHTIYRDRENSNSHFRGFRDSVRIYKEIIKFTLSSFSSFVLDYVLFSLLMFFLPHTAAALLLANIAARAVSAFYNYSMNCRFVFHAEQKMRGRAEYFALAGFILVMNNLILESFVQVLHVPVYPAKLLTECLLFVMSWLIQKNVIFRKERRPGTYALMGRKAEG